LSGNRRVQGFVQCLVVVGAKKAWFDNLGSNFQQGQNSPSFGLDTVHVVEAKHACEPASVQLLGCLSILVISKRAT
jgi:hypothetical protein